MVDTRGEERGIEQVFGWDQEGVRSGGGRDGRGERLIIKEIN